MTPSTPIRAGALAAIAGGALRAAASFAPTVIASGRWRESLYVVIDVCLTAGLIAFYAQRSRRAWTPATAGLGLALVGIAIVRANRWISTADLYPVGALAIACGVIVLSVSVWRARKLPGWIPAVFLFSTLLGLVGTLAQCANALFVCSGVLFGIAFAGLGVVTWTGARHVGSA